jgi:hypothetical protein
MAPRNINVPKPHVQEIAMYVAMAVRNEMEDFHVKHLTDAQMAELNPIIRNAIYTALYASVTMSSPASQSFVGHNTLLIPKYWEQPQLTESYLGLVELYRQRQAKTDENE